MGDQSPNPYGSGAYEYVLHVV